MIFTDGSTPVYVPDMSLDDGDPCLRFNNGRLADRGCGYRYSFLCVSDILTQGNDFFSDKCPIWSICASKLPKQTSHVRIPKEYYCLFQGILFIVREVMHHSKGGVTPCLKPEGGSVKRKSRVTHREDIWRRSTHNKSMSF